MQRYVVLTLKNVNKGKDDDFYVSMKELADDAELCDECLDVRLVTSITSGVRDQQSRKKLLAIDPPTTLPAALSLCRSEESAFNTDVDLSCGEMRVVNKKADHNYAAEVSLQENCVMAVEVTGSIRDANNVPHGGKRTTFVKALVTLAKFVRKKNHKIPEDKIPRHHFREQPEFLKIGGLKSRDEKRTLKICVGVSRVSLHIIFTPDTGAETTAIGVPQLVKAGIPEQELSQGVEECVFAVNNEKFTLKGSFEAILSLGRKSAVTTIEVFQELDDVLMSWHDANALQIIP